VAQVTVVLLYLTSDIGFLWFNVIGCAIVVGLSSSIELVRPSARRPRTP
jgi:solute:Na+ symporter, SSS family